MAGIKYSSSKTGIPITTFEDTFLTHKRSSEWWYETGYVNDAEGKLYSFQFTLAKVTIAGITFHILISCVTDFSTGKHYNNQLPIFMGRGVISDNTALIVRDAAVMRFEPNDVSSMGKMKLSMKALEFDLTFDMEAVKPPVRQCEDGILQMGILNNPKERTFYFSFTNIKVSGTLSIAGKDIGQVSGKAWFDRQGGTYHLTNRFCNWEWFSLRFFDESEAMLFAFPQDGYYDGTRIFADGTYRRMNDYHIMDLSYITYEGLRFSSSWEVQMEGRRYLLKPLTRGMYNIFFFELLADIVEIDTGKKVGYCFVELLPGVYNKNSIRDAFKKKT